MSYARRASPSSRRPARPSSQLYRERDESSSSYTSRQSYRDYDTDIVRVKPKDRTAVSQPRAGGAQLEASYILPASSSQLRPQAQQRRLSADHGRVPARIMPPPSERRGESTYIRPRGSEAPTALVVRSRADPRPMVQPVSPEIVRRKYERDDYSPRRTNERRSVDYKPRYSDLKGRDDPPDPARRLVKPPGDPGRVSESESKEHERRRQRRPEPYEDDRRPGADRSRTARPRQDHDSDSSPDLRPEAAVGVATTALVANRLRKNRSPSPEHHKVRPRKSQSPSPVQYKNRSRKSRSTSPVQHKIRSRKSRSPSPQNHKSRRRNSTYESDDSRRSPSPAPPRRRREYHRHRSRSATSSSSQESQFSTDEERRPPARVVTPSTEATSNVYETQSATKSAIPKGILKRPKERFPEESTIEREGVAPLDATAKGIPPEARWTRINRRLVNPEALKQEGLRFEEYTDHVIVLKVLSQDDIARITRKTHEIREQRRRASFQGDAVGDPDISSAGISDFSKD